MDWTQAQGQFTDGAKEEFASEPDAWLIAYALANNFLIVTHEKLAPDAKKRVPIPNVCDAFQVKYVDTFKMLRAIGFRFK